MPPKATVTRGRPKRFAVPDLVVEDAPKKRGRAAKVTAAEPQPEPELESVPKRRGRPSKLEADQAVEDTPAIAPRIARRAGRPRKEPVDDNAPAPTKRVGRPRKDDVNKKAPSSPPKRRGRQPKAALDLNRVAGSPRVSKRNSRAKAVTKAQPAPAPRIDPRVRSKLRTRAASAPKAAVVSVPKPKKRMGRPPKAAAKPTKSVERTTKDGRITKPNARVTKGLAKPRKKRGYTTLEIEDKYVKDIEIFLEGLRNADAAVEPTAAVEEESAVEELKEQDEIPVVEDNEEKEPSELSPDDIESVQDVEIGIPEQLIDAAEPAEATEAGIDSQDDRYDESRVDVEDPQEPSEVVQIVQVEEVGDFDMDVDVNKAIDQELLQRAIIGEMSEVQGPPDSLFEEFDSFAAGTPAAALPNNQFVPPTFD